MGRHMRNHEIGTATRAGVIRPAWPTLDRQPTEPFAVNLARCRKCGDALRAVAGGSWIGRQSADAVCRRSGRWPWSGREHVIDATPLDDGWPWWALALPLLVVGPVVLVLVSFLAVWIAKL